MSLMLKFVFRLVFLSVFISVGMWVDRTFPGFVSLYMLVTFILFYTGARIYLWRRYGTWRCEIEQMWLPFYACVAYLAGLCLGLGNMVLYALPASLLAWWLTWLALITVRRTG